MLDVKQQVFRVEFFDERHVSQLSFCSSFLSFFLSSLFLIPFALFFKTFFLDSLC